MAIRIDQRALWAVAAATLGMFCGLLQAEEQKARQSFCVAYDSEVIVERDDIAVTHLDFDGYIKARVPDEQQQAFLNSPKRISEVLETLLSTYSMARRAQETDMLNDHAFRAAVYISIARELATAYQEHYMEEGQLDSYENAARELYLVDPSSFMTPKTYNFRHILIAEQSDSSEIELMRQSLQVYEQINSGKDFDEVAAGLDSVPDDVQTFMEGVELESLVAPLRGMMRDAEEGKLLAPVRSQHGWHVVKIDSINPPREMTWEESRESATARARQRHQRMLQERLKQDIQSEEPRFADDAVFKLLNRYDVSWSNSASRSGVADSMNKN